MLQNAVLIRPLTVADARACWDIRLRAFTESPGSFNTSPDDWRTHPISEIQSLLSGEKGSPSDVVIGAFDPALVGHIALRREPRRKLAHRATLSSLYVAPEARGHGLGQRLMQALLDHARAQPDLVIIELTVMADNGDALRLYHRFGFRRYGYQARAAQDATGYRDEERLMLDLDASANSPR
ncbi:MAG: GNAT family N-acetyltransferase [Polyangiaceae bacterium]